MSDFNFTKLIALCSKNSQKLSKKYKELYASRIYPFSKKIQSEFLPSLKPIIFTLGQRKKTIGLLVFLLVFFGGIVVIKVNPSKGKGRDVSDFTIKAEIGRLSSIITASGELQAQKSINVNPHRQGLLAEIYVDEGDEVKRGQLIAKIDSRDFLFRLNELNAEFENKKTAFERRKRLFNEGAISAETYNDYKKSFLTSQARLEQLKVEGKELSIRAPFSGIITARYAESGSFVSPTSQSSSTQSSIRNSVVELSQGLQVLAKVPESDIGRIQIGQEASVRVEAFPDERFKSLVNDIAPRAIKNNNVTSFEVKLFFINPPKKLRIGMTSDIEFKAGETGLKTLVPTVAIATEEGEPGLYIIGKDNQPLFRKVDLGSSSGSKTAILKGIKPGDIIFIDLPPWSKRKRN